MTEEVWKGFFRHGKRGAIPDFRKCTPKPRLKGLGGALNLGRYVSRKKGGGPTHPKKNQNNTPACVSYAANWGGRRGKKTTANRVFFPHCAGEPPQELRLGVGWGEAGGNGTNAASIRVRRKERGGEWRRARPAEGSEGERVRSCTERIVPGEGQKKRPADVEVFTERDRAAGESFKDRSASIE